MAPLLPTAVIAYKQKRFNTAALEAIKVHDARIQIVPVEAKLNANGKVIIARDPRQFYVSLPLLSCSECVTEASLVQPLERTTRILDQPVLWR